MTTPAEREFAEQVGAWTPPWNRQPDPEGPPEADEKAQHPQLPPDVHAVRGESAVVPSPQEMDTTAPADSVPVTTDGEPEEVEPKESTLAPLDPHELRSAIEAILLIVDEPVTDVILAQVLGHTTEMVAEALTDLAEDYTKHNRGFELRRAAGGWRLYTREEFAPYVEKFVLDGQQTRLTQAALETLAVVAYKQPVTRGRVSAIRGVNCDGVLRTLLTRGLIEECGSEPESGAYLYRTTVLFLEKLGIDSLDELPPLAPFLPDDIDAVVEAHEQP